MVKLTTSQASFVGVLLYFLAGLLPDPDGPWTPTAAHCHAWITGILLEAVIAAVFKSQQHLIDTPQGLLDSLFGLGLARIVVLAFMIMVLIRRYLELRSATRQGSDSERQSLLENGDGPTNGYTHTNGTKPEVKKARDPQKSGWFDYIAGFRVLFPYLW